MNKDSGKRFTASVLSFLLFLGSIFTFGSVFASEKNSSEAELVSSCSDSSCKITYPKQRRRLMDRETEEVILDQEQCIPLGTITLDDEETPLGSGEIKKPKKANLKVCFNKCPKKEANENKIYLKFTMDKDTIQNINKNYRGFYDLAFVISGGFLVVEEAN